MLSNLFRCNKSCNLRFFFWGGGPNALACEPPSHPPTNQPSGKPRQPRNQPGDADHAQGFQVDKASQAFGLRGLPDLLDVGLEVRSKWLGWMDDKPTYKMGYIGLITCNHQME